MTTEEKQKLKIQELLGKEVTRITLKAKVAVNFAYLVETSDGKYIVKQEREDKEFQSENDLVAEANIIKKLHDLNLSLPIPTVTFASENPKIYGYEYIEGELLKDVWPFLSEEERINICRDLGYFHAEIGKKVSKKMAQEIGACIDMSAGFHPETVGEYARLSTDSDVPEEFRDLVKQAKTIFDDTLDRGIFQFIHNDSHHENILIKDKKISGIIDFGNAQYGEIAKEFSRYIRDFPDYFQHIVSAYEEESGNKLFYERLVSNALVSGFIDIVESYNRGEEDREKAEQAIATYRKLLDRTAIS